METGFAETTALMHNVNAGLAQLDRATSQSQASTLEQTVSAQLGSIDENVRRLESAVSREPVAKRRTAKYRLDQLVYDAQQLRAQLTRLTQRAQQRFRVEAEREELLSRRFVSPAAGDTALQMDEFAATENDRLKSSHAQMDQILDQSRAVLGSIKDQAGFLKGMRRKMRDVAETMGLSNTVLRMIERRTAQDKMILFGGMAITLLLMFVIYKGFKA